MGKRVIKRYYGMRQRGFSLGCQPRDCYWVEDEEVYQNELLRELKAKYQYHDIICCERRLTALEMKQYELDYLYTKGEEE